MSLIDRYLLREWLAIFALVVGACLGLLQMQAMYDEMRDLLDVGAGLIDVTFYFVVALPSYLAVVLPLGLLLSLLYALGRLHRNQEVTAMRAAGLGVFRITRSIWIAGVLLCGIAWYLHTTLIPWSVEESRSVLQGLRFRQDAQAVQADRVGATTTVAFDNQREGRVWFMNRYSRYTDRGYGVSVSELDAQRLAEVRTALPALEHRVLL